MLYYRAESDLIYLCDSEAALNKISRWIGSGPRTTLAGDANTDIMTTIIECVRERVLRGARTFMVKIKARNQAWYKNPPSARSATASTVTVRSIILTCSTAGKSLFSGIFSSS